MSPTCVCPRCHYETPKASTFIDHLMKSKPCPCDFSDDAREDIIESFKTRSFACPHCARTFSRSRHLSRHEGSCKSKEIVSALRSTIVELENEVENALDQKSVVIHNNTTYIQNNIILNNFGSEDRSHVTRDVLLKCLDELGTNSLVDCVYFNPDHPENKTIRLKSEKKKRVLLHQDGKWVEDDMNNSIDRIMNRENSALSTFFYESVWPDETVNFDNKALTHEKLTRINDRNKAYFDQRRSIQAKLKNDIVDLVVYSAGQK